MKLSRTMTFGFLALVAACIVPAIAARSPATAPITPTRMEVLVFETDDCLYCHIFRRDVVPQYEASQRAKMAPMRFLDARETDAKSVGLSTPVRTLPTIVIMRDGRERGRIDGYTGPEPFFHMIARIVRNAQ